MMIIIILTIKEIINNSYKNGKKINNKKPNNNI